MNQEIQLKKVNNLEALSQAELDSAVSTYQNAFALLPYLEVFTYEDALGAFQYILDKDGDLIIGQDQGDVVSLAGGYLKPDNTYYIEELAVDPRRQSEGLGRKTLENLLSLGLTRNPATFELRTTAGNDKAIRLYQSEGFTVSSIREVVPQLRQDGNVALDERIYLTKTIKEETMQQPNKLKRAAIAYPSGNTTAVIFDQCLDTNRQELNTQVMEAWKESFSNQPEIEQCCFVTLPKDPKAVARVEMFGSEFCGNATRSVISLITKGRDCAGLIEVSGVDRPLKFTTKDGVVNVEMPLPQQGDLAKTVEEGTLVNLDGIAQLVITDPLLQQSRSPRQTLTTLLAENKYGLAEQPAVGISYYDQKSNRAQFAVWVKNVNTIFDETACGSGTCAIGVALSQAAGQSRTLEVIQPSGESIETQSSYDQQTNQVIGSVISGPVSVLYDGELTLS